MDGLAQLAANWATTIGILLAIVVFIVDRIQARHERELDTYRDLSAKYFDYLEIVLNSPDVSTTETEWSRKLKPDGPVKQSVVILIAVNMIESAYFMYEGHRSSFRRAQWNGWYAYLLDWCAHPAFVAAWPEIIDQYDANFQEVVRKAFQEVNSPNAASDSG
jgi:hypothetical protein